MSRFSTWTSQGTVMLSTEQPKEGVADNRYSD